MRLGLEGKACVVTGAAGGIGRATAELLLREGAQVIAVGRDAGALECIAARGGVPLAADVRDPAAADLVVSACLERFGVIDVLVNSEAEPAHAPLATLSDDDWQAQWDLNVMAPMRLMRAAAPVMARAGGGRVVNVASAAGKRPAPQNAAYSVTQAAQLSVSRAFADTYAAQGVLVNAVAPAEDLGDRAAERPPIGRFGTPEEAAAVVLFLCSDIASVVTGAAWSADGGAVKAIV